MTFTRIKYGFMILSGIAVTGTTIYFSGTRKSLEPIDEIEIKSGSYERTLASRYATNPINVGTQAWKYLEVTGVDASGLTYVSGPNTHQYVAVRWVSTNSIFTNDPGTYYEAPWSTYYVMHEQTTTQRFLWGPYSNITVAGVTGNTNYNGRYDWYSRSFGIVDVGYPVSPWEYSQKTQVPVDYYRQIKGALTLILEDYGPCGQSPQSMLGPITMKSRGALGLQTAAVTYDSLVRQDYASWTNVGIIAFHGNWKGASVTLGPLKTSHIRGASTYRSTIVRNPVLRVILKEEIQALSDGARDVTPYYVNDADASGGEFVGFASLPMMTVTNTFKLITGVTNVWFPDETNNSWTVRTNDWALRYKYIEKLKWTHAHTSSRSWSADGGDNTYYWDSGGAHGTWAAAVAACEADTPTTSQDNQAPAALTWGYYSSAGGYRAFAFARRSKGVSSGLTTNVPCTADFYARPAAITDDSVEGYPFLVDDLETVEFSMQDSGTGTEDELGRYDSGVSRGTHASSVTSSVWYGQTTFPSEWCPEPAAVHNDGSARGFTVSGNGDKDVVHKWDFEYCDDAMP